MKTLLFNSLNKAVNAYLNLDPNSRTRLQSLQDKVVTIELLPLHYNLHFSFDENGIVLQEEESTPSTVKIIGTPMQLFGLMLNKENRQSFFTDDVKIEGDAEVGQEVINLFDELDIDWEELIAQTIGDTPAYNFSKFVMGMKEWGSKLDQSFTPDLRDFLQEEIGALPSKASMNDYYDEIDLLRMDVDRAEAKILELKKILHEDDQ